MLDAGGAFFGWRMGCERERKSTRTVREGVG